MAKAAHGGGKGAAICMKGKVEVGESKGTRESIVTRWRWPKMLETWHKLPSPKHIELG